MHLHRLLIELQQENKNITSIREICQYNLNSDRQHNITWKLNETVPQ